MRNYLLGLVLVLAFVLAGCADQGGEVSANWNTFIGGTEGISVVFDTGTPPAEVNVGEEFIVMLVLENQGEYTVPEDQYFVQLMGISAQEFGTSTSELLVTGAEIGEPLQAREMNVDTGETIDSYPVYVEIPQDGMLSYTGGIAGNTPFTFAADVCYSYRTTANGKMCIKEELTRSSDSKVCTISGPQAIASSGGPVQIANLQEFSGGKDSVRFSFTVMEASAGGDLSAPGSECSSATVDEDKVYVTVDTGFDGLECSGFLGSERSAAGGVAGYIKLSGGSRQVTCTQDLTGLHDTDYVKVMEITAEYDYEESVSTQVLVKNAE